MSLRINTNVTAINALNNLQQTSNAVATSIERLSSGISAAVVDTNDVAGIFIGGTFNNVATQSGAVTITVTGAASRATAIGNATYASVNASLSTVNGTTTGSGGSVVINGQSIVVTGSDSVQSL